MRAVELIMRYCPQFQFEVQSNNSAALDRQPSKMILHDSLSGWPVNSRALVPSNCIFLSFSIPSLYKFQL